jgi:hypothetical protein
MGLTVFKFVLARYSGISDKNQLLFFQSSIFQNESILLSQIVWYFMKVYTSKSKEYPFRRSLNYFKYIVPIEEEINILQSDKTDRWWIEIQN